jgi:hypothetical protein
VEARGEEQRRMTTEERNKALTLRGFEEMFNRGDLSVVDELVADPGRDH